MREHNFNLLLSSIVAIAMPIMAQAEVPRAAVVRLEAAGGGCGTAFFIDGQTLISSAHFVRANCPAGDCSGLRMVASSDLDQNIASVDHAPSVTLQLHTLLNELDVASLRLNQASPHAALDGAHSIPPALKQDVTVLHYPACGELVLSSGVITASGALDFSVDTSVNYGSSGGAVVDRDGVVLGVVSQAASVFAAARARLVGGSFNGKIIRYDIVSAALENPGLVPQLLLSWYQSDISNLVGFQRLYDGQRFIRSVDRLRTRLISAGELNPALMLATDYPDSFASLPNSTYFGPQTLELEQLAFAASLEKHGPFSGELHLLDTNALENSLQKAGRPSAHIAELRRMVIRLWEQKYPGFELMSESLVFSCSVLGVILAVIWGWSLGRVFSTSRGSIWHRVLVTFLVAILVWPISWLFYVLRQRRGRADVFSN